MLLLWALVHTGCCGDEPPSTTSTGEMGTGGSSSSGESGNSTGSTSSASSGATGSSSGLPSCGQGGSGGAGVWQGILQFGSTGDDEGVGIGLDSAGNVYVLGQTNGAWADVPGQSQGTDMFILKMNSSGGAEWSARLGSAGMDDSSGFVVTTDGRSFLVGSATGSVDGQPYLGEKDTIAAAYDTNGTRLWLVQSGSPLTDVAKDVALHPSGDPVVVGYTLANTAKQGEMFVTRMAATSGMANSEMRFGTTEFDTATAIGYDKLGNAYVCGHSAGNFGGASAGSFDVVLIKYDVNGAQQWIRQLGTVDIDGSFAVATDALGNIYVAAVSHSDLVSGTFEDDVLRDAFLLQFDANGNRTWTRRPSTQPDRETFVETIVTGSDGIYMGGWTEADLDGLPNRGGHDAFVLKYDFAGNLAWVRQYGTAGDDTVGQIVVNVQGNLYVVGTAGGNFPGQTGAGGSDVFVLKLDPNGQPL